MSNNRRCDICDAKETADGEIGMKLMDLKHLEKELLEVLSNKQDYEQLPFEIRRKISIRLAKYIKLKITAQKKALEEERMK